MIRHLLIWCLGPYQEVEVIPQQAVGVGIDNRLDVFRIPLHEGRVVALLVEDGLAVRAAIEDVMLETHL